MNFTEILKLTRKLMTLLVLLGGLFFALNYAEPVAAAPCCSDCFAQEEQCYQIEDPVERQQCLQQVFRCFRWCDFDC